MSDPEEDICAICLDTMTKNNEDKSHLVQPNCGHTFHKICIDYMMKCRKRLDALPCPLCRKPMQNTERRFLLGPSAEEQLIERTVGKLVSTLVMCGSVIINIVVGFYNLPTVHPICPINQLIVLFTLFVLLYYISRIIMLCCLRTN